MKDTIQFPKKKYPLLKKKKKKNLTHTMGRGTFGVFLERTTAFIIFSQQNTDGKLLLALI